MHHLTREQTLELFRQARAHSERDWILLLVTFWHGLRASEAINLTPENFRDGHLNVQRLKGSLRTIQPLVEHEDVLLNERAAVESWLTRPGALRGDAASGRLFRISRSQFYRLMRLYGRLAGLPQHLSHPHVLKHSIAMQSIREAGIENVRQYLGHRSISSTGEYLKVSDSEAASAVSVAVRKAAPRNPGV